MTLPGQLNGVFSTTIACGMRGFRARCKVARSVGRSKNEIHAALQRRLMTVPGVNLVCAASFIAAVGDPHRFFTSRKLVAYLGLDPKVKQSGDQPARGGRISKRGSTHARWALVEAAWSTVPQPGPLHAFYQCTKARRGHGKAIVTIARKLTVLFWCTPTRDEDYAHQ